MIEYTKQEVINKIWQHFIVEKNPPSYNALPQKCMYRLNRQSNDKCRCFIGVLIPDELYSSEFDDNMCMTSDVLTQIGITVTGQGLSCIWLLNLQSMHDHSSTKLDFHSRIEFNLRQLIQKEGLEVPN